MASRIGWLAVFLCWAVGVWATPQADPPPKLFRSDALNLSFSMGVDWKLERSRNQSRILIPLAGTRATATADLFETDFRQTAEDWQRIQQTVNEQLQRTVERQWTEELLGVPLLMTRISYLQGGQETTTLIGLLYSATRMKLHFRLTAPSEQFSEVEQAWRGALLSIRTLSGTSLTPENPEQELPTQPKVVPPSKARPPLVLKTEAELRRERATMGPVRVSLVVSTRNVLLAMAQGFAATLQNETVTITHPQLKGQVTVKVNALIDSPRPERALATQAAESLSQFSQVKQRRDELGKVSKAGAMVAWTRREGSSGPEQLVIWDAVGTKDEHYWTLQYRSADASAWAQDEKVLRQLLDSLVVGSAQ